MRFSLAMPHGSELAAQIQPWERAVGGPEIARAVRLADELGFCKLMMGEHFIIPNDHADRSGQHFLQVTTALGFIAGHTQRLRLSSSLTILPLQHPIVHAKLWATLDWLSGGRAEMMVGAGWLEKEFQILGVDFHERGRMCDEYVQAIRELWTSDKPSFEGRYVSFRDADALPKPIQKGGVPIWFGGEADAVLRRVAKWGAGWSPATTPPETFPERLDYIRSQPEYDGRPIALQFALSRLGIRQDHSATGHPDAKGRLDAAYVLDQVGWLAGLGVTEMRMAPPVLADFEAYLDWLRWVAAEIMPRAG